MAVLVADREESDFKVITQAIKIRRELTTYVLRDFAVNGKLSYMEEWLLNDERAEILHDARNAHSCLVMANSIYITNWAEYYERRLNQDKAIGYYARLKQELLYVIDTMPGKININKYMVSIKMIKNEINMISAWRKSDNKLKKNLPPDNKKEENYTG